MFSLLPSLKKKIKIIRRITIGKLTTWSLTFVDSTCLTIPTKKKSKLKLLIKSFALRIKLSLECLGNTTKENGNLFRYLCIHAGILLPAT